MSKISPKNRDKILQAVRTRHLQEEDTPGRVLRNTRDAVKDTDSYSHVLLAGEGEPCHPPEVFPRLRWGGVFAFVAGTLQQAHKICEEYKDEKSGFVIEKEVTPIKTGFWFLGAKGFFFLARKVDLLMPGDTTERFTYSVKLVRHPKGPDAPFGWCVWKQVPTFDNLIWRLSKKFPDADPNDLRKRAKKLVASVFPTFLTRETAILKILQTNLPEQYKGKVPRCLGVEKDEKGFVRGMKMNWLRNGGEPLSQLEFAKQSAELLAALHDDAKVMHLDLRLDNFVITEDGVGFIDFGSAVRIGENLKESPMLESLFSEMMRTSQIQRMLGKMIEKGHVTNDAIREVYGRVDKTVDTFYLAVQINRPTGNPELIPLIAYDDKSEMAAKLGNLTAAVLRPKSADAAQFKTAGDILRGVHSLEKRMNS